MVKVNAGSLVGARANTPVGRGAVVSVRDVSVRCEVETVRVNHAETVEDITTKTANTTCNRTGDGANFDAEEGQRTALAKESRAYHHPRTTEYDQNSPSVVERGTTGSPRSLRVDESNRRRIGHDSHNEGGAEAPGRVERQEEGHCVQAMPPPTVCNKRCLNKQITHVASRKGAPGDSSACDWARDDGRRLSGGDDDDKRDAWDGCSVRTETAAEFEEWAVTTVHERTRGDFEPEQVGDGSWTAHEGTSTASNAR